MSDEHDLESASRGTDAVGASGGERPPLAESPAMGESQDESAALAAVSGRHTVVLAGFLLVVMLSLAATTWLRSGPVIESEDAAALLDPNVAPWWELTALPGIGETTARAIVEYREEAAGETGPAASVFRRAADLDAVRGIGPKTVAKIAPYLRFPVEPEDVREAGTPPKPQGAPMRP